MTPSSLRARRVDSKRLAACLAGWSFRVFLRTLDAILASSKRMLFSRSERVLGPEGAGLGVVVVMLIL